jgi:F0F1-type ATP synthase assembly protein I
MVVLALQLKKLKKQAFLIQLSLLICLIILVSIAAYSLEGFYPTSTTRNFSLLSEQNMGTKYVQEIYNVIIMLVYFVLPQIIILSRLKKLNSPFVEKPPIEKPDLLG